MLQIVPSFKELLDSAQHLAFHLEMHDIYSADEERDHIAAWRQGGRPDDPGSAQWRPWVDLVRRTVGRGVLMRRARTVSEPVTEYIRYEHAGTSVNIGAGEQVRWLPRHRASDIALPGNDFWLIDDRIVRFNIFTGDGAATDPQASEEPTVIKLCTSAFEEVWARAVPHEEYEIT